jgi:hypothetical protein
LPDYFRLQIATDALFTTIVKDQTGMTSPNLTVSTGLLGNTKYYWRVYGANAVGVGKWSSVNSFTTMTALPLTLIDFKGTYITNNTIKLNWQTTDEQHVSHFIIEKSMDAADKFIEIGNVKATGNARETPQYYSLLDAQPSRLNWHLNLPQISIIVPRNDDPLLLTCVEKLRCPNVEINNS